MDSTEELREENERLRSLVEEFRQRELTDIRQQLAEAKAEAVHYRQEAERNADLGRKIALGYQEQVAELRGKLEAAERAYYARPRFEH